ncbi:4-oxalomesaconate tautomerase [Cellulophaga sp. BC115SP]|uniref:4-oxalomesaconate tautomerase n=1 Tax=Cellulophaga sp. BC115SP TaxID=2683263 RepID=UPI00141267A8|nr:4-oxalomesaconate tautomerase [Cellulophaga sp. BC115SP]NBB29746.1 4-oxalomesaconate tautomerase [Cellulophaga sp. BC115SP]
MQLAIPYMHFRGGSSKGLFFLKKDLPEDENLRNQYLIAAIEGTTQGDGRQIDGLGGGSSLSSKIAIVSPSSIPEADLDYFFVQVQIGKGKVSTLQTCGNMLAGVLPFAIESGIFKANSPTTSAKINMVNTGGICEVIVQTPDYQVQYNGNTKIDGVVGTSAPIICNYLETVGATCGALLPTGNNIDIIHGIEATCIDNGMPVVIMRASDFGLSGYESISELEANEPLKQTIEAIRLVAGEKMQLGDVSQQTIPKMCLIAPPIQGGVLHTRMFIPHVVHEAIGVLAAVSVATACILPKSITQHTAHYAENSSFFSVEHPSGEFTVNLEYLTENQEVDIKSSGVIRTARLISKGEVYISI